ncbi:MAG: hypothetical protein A4E48_01352 [Methanosaeta sp. PtaU1.Bin060]|jgi:hypothetical protein|nr:MAG: hypothetical protein A4E48_01352 [Methanosaeta sp. PtaU1.Bin060]
MFGGMNIATKLMFFVLALSMLIASGAAQDGSGFGHPPGYMGDGSGAQNAGDWQDGNGGDRHPGGENWGDHRHDGHDWLGVGGHTYYWSYPSYYDYGWYPHYTYTYYPTYYYYTTPVAHTTYQYAPLNYNWFDPWWTANVYGGSYTFSSWSWL